MTKSSDAPTRTGEPSATTAYAARIDALASQLDALEEAFILIAAHVGVDADVIWQASGAANLTVGKVEQDIP